MALTAVFCLARARCRCPRCNGQGRGEPPAALIFLYPAANNPPLNGAVDNYFAQASVHVMVMSFWLMSVSRTLVFSAQKVHPMMLTKYVNLAGGTLLIIFYLYGLIKFTARSRKINVKISYLSERQTLR